MSGRDRCGTDIRHAAPAGRRVRAGRRRTRRKAAEGTYDRADAGAGTRIAHQGQGRSLHPCLQSPPDYQLVPLGVVYSAVARIANRNAAPEQCEPDTLQGPTKAYCSICAGNRARFEEGTRPRRPILNAALADCEGRINFRRAGRGLTSRSERTVVAPQVST